MTYREMLDHLRRSPAFEIDGPEGVGKLPAETFEDVNGDVVAFTEWGGWLWTAWAVMSDDDAIRRLETRLSRLAPFEGEDSDWGPIGCSTGEPLDQGLSEADQRDMLEVHAELTDEARYLVEPE